MLAACLTDPQTLGEDLRRTRVDLGVQSQEVAPAALGIQPARSSDNDGLALWGEMPAHNPACAGLRAIAALQPSNTATATHEG